MPINKVVYGTSTLIDLTDSTLSSSAQLLSGVTAYDRTGAKLTGTYSGGSGDGYVWQDGNGYVHLSDEEGTHVTIDALTISSSGVYTASTGHAYSPVTVPSGTTGTPTATKGTVSSHSITITPSVTNAAGYITGGTINGTAVTVSASELVSGTYSVTSAGTANVTSYASISVPSGTAGTPTATKGTVTNHSVTVTPSVTNSAGYISGGSINGTAVTVSASELVSGTYSITANTTGLDISEYAYVDVSVSGGGGGLEYEEGTFTPAEDVAQPTIYFNDTHSTEPMFISLQDASGTDATTNNYLFWTIVRFSAIDQNSPQYSNGSVITLARVAGQYMANDTAASNWQQSVYYTGSASTQYLGYWMTSTWFRPYLNSATRYLKAGKAYKWVAVWAPTA